MLDFHAIMIKDIITISISLFAIIDVVGSIPAIIQAKAGMSHFKPAMITALPVC